MNPNRLNIILALLLLVSVVFGVHQAFTVKRLKAMATFGQARGAIDGDRESLAMGVERVSRGASGDARAADTRSGGIHSGDTVREASSEAGPEGKTGEQSKISREIKAGAEKDNHPDSPISVSIGRDGKLRTGAPSWADTGTSGRSAKRKVKGDAAQRKNDRNGRDVPDAVKSRDLLNQAQTLIQEGRYDTAEELLTQSLEEDETNRMAWQQMARLQHKQGLTDAEITTYLDWMEASPGDASPYYQLATTYARLGQDAEARYYLGEYESLAGRESHMYSQAAAVYRQLEDRGEEGRVLSQWLATAPESVDARQAWADYNRRLGGYDVALNQYQQLAAVMPNNPRLYQQIGDVYRQLGDYAQAQYNYQSALNLRPNDTGILGRLGDLNYQNGDFEGALSAYSEIIALEPGSNAAERAQRRIITIEEQVQRSGAYPVN